ncbi:hypothetical protein ILUMI_11374 [Ignelater luminosus]|uniref:E3 ubiquitin-protein ligase Topors n=1 Tax=Ignelater luminosus TaxID=2038154 RepID=A0A8K0D091_IGNLU|nr:hypothetical protein ILUMI_11374 [Ignelater luminosus]
MNEVASSSTPPRPASAASPPPKCAICLGTCTNKCFSDSCMHQFCFTCLLEWSKVKAECPLCKQPFKSIIHNIKSNDEYDEHFIEVPEPRDILGNDDAGFLYLPPAPSRHFQFRTTFTVDPDGELAIQQMLLSHPLTNSMYNVPGNYVLPRYSSRFGRRYPRRASSATSFRRWVYMSNMWVYAPPDLTGRYRDVTPHFYRDNPAARNRLVPWLNRELNALLRENTQQVMHLVDVIMDHLTRWHIRSRSFKNLLSSHLENKTNHFIHEFYNFMRSPYDMIGYDRHIVYTDRPYSPTYSISDHDDDSDVAIVNISEPVGADNNPFRRPTIEIIEINSDSSHDSDVIIRETPVPEIVLVDSDSTTEIDGRTPEPTNNNISESASESETNRKPILPLKIRLKHKRQSRERRSRNKKHCSKRHYSSSSGSSSTCTDTIDSSTSSTSSSHKRYSKRKRKYKKLKRSHKESKLSRKEKTRAHSKSTTVISDNNSSNDESDASKKPVYDSDDCIPLSKLKGAEKRKKLKKARHPAPTSSSRTHTITSRNVSNRLSTDEEDEAVAQITINSNSNTDVSSKPSCSGWKLPEVASSTHVESKKNMREVLKMYGSLIHKLQLMYRCKIYILANYICLLPVYSLQYILV